MGSRSGYDKSSGNDVIWLGFQEKMPEVLRCFIDKWTAEAINYTNYQICCPVKYAGIVFRYENIWYRISPGSIGITEETLGGLQSCWVNEMFENLAGKMGTELVELGAEDVFYTGMMD